MRNSSIITVTLRTLFRSWAIAVGFVALATATCWFINKTLLPAILLVLAYVISAIMNARRMNPQQVCLRIAWTVRCTFIISAFVMFVLVLLHVRPIFDGRFDGPGFNPRIPYVTGIVLFTIGSLVSLYAIVMGRSLGVCRACRRVYGDYDTNSLASSLFHDESSRQLRLFFWICTGIAVAQWVYFFVFYINVNFNSPDLFFFNYMPVAVYVFSLVFLASRYYSIAEAYRASVADGTPMNSGSDLRFIVTNGDDMLLNENTEGQWDTPYKAHVPAAQVGDEKALERFVALGGPDDTQMRFLYTNKTQSGENIVHYAAFVADAAKDSATRGARWFSSYEVDRFLHSGRLAPMLANELVRIYTITMAWKTYNRQGRRLYPIKHYKPIFRLRDFKEWDVEYNHQAWLQISEENEDTRFYRARRLLRKCLGIFNR